MAPEFLSASASSPVGKAPSPSYPFRIRICAGSAGVVMNLFAGKIVSPSGICGTENALWPRLLRNFYFPWSCIDLAPIAFQFTQNPTLLKFRRKKKNEDRGSWEFSYFWEPCSWGLITPHFCLHIRCMMHATLFLMKTLPPASSPPYAPGENSPILSLPPFQVA